MIIQSGYFNHSKLGPVHYIVRANSRRIVATWHDGTLRVSLPPFANLSVLAEQLDRMESRLSAIKPTPVPIYNGRHFDFPDFSVTLKVVPGRRRGMSVCRRNDTEYDLILSDAVDLGSYGVRKAVEKAVVAVARMLAPEVLLPRARQIAAQHNLEVSRWQVSSGRKLLGRCSSRRVISLSAVLMLLPVELRDYVVCHELAHLTEMNHSASFHRLCNRYCLGREKVLEKALKQQMKQLRANLLS